ncbi:hypothetical protein FGD67_07420 [Colwellia sp. M166]|uniref:hypothetical protein n=1 Tax=Colwellia sp. M166 TaxID=2583805 RepID=UPI00211E0314|nr:hypothetical protein [Colwellia sp. M166]UUO23047.1 hypothetical protein FGD67_07420 [Colwellia sp. M166]
MKLDFHKLTFRDFLLFLVFIVLPIFDSINGYLVAKGLIAPAGLASPSQLGRLAVSSLLIYILATKKLSIPPVFFLIYLLTVEVFSGLYHQSQYGFTYGVISAYKIGYLIFLTVLLKHYSKSPQGMGQLVVFLKYNLIIIATMLYFSTITGIGNSTYGFGFGTKSFFASGNGLGLYLGVGSLFLIGARHYKLTGFSQKTLLYIVLSIALIGSKTALILCAFNLLCIIVLSKYRASFIIVLSALVFIFLPAIIDTLSVLFDVILNRLTNSDNLILYLGSGRIDYVVDAFGLFLQEDPNPFRLLFGMGAYTSFQDPLFVREFDTLETDLFDLLFMYGLFAVIAYLAVIGVVLFKLRNYKVLFLGMLLLSLHSIIAGHVLFNGMSSVCFALFICVASFLSNKRTLNDKVDT